MSPDGNEPPRNARVYRGRSRTDAPPLGRNNAGEVFLVFGNNAIAGDGSSAQDVGNLLLIDSRILFHGQAVHADGFE